MSKQLLIVNSDTDLTTYKLGAVVALSAVSPGDTEIAFNDGRYGSLDLDSGEVRRAVTRPYSAGTKQVSSVTLPGGQSEYYITVIKSTAGTQNLPRKTATGATVAAVVANLTAEFARPDSDFYGFTVSVAGQVVTITASLNNHFRLAATAGSTIAYTTTWAKTQGRSADVQALETLVEPFNGITNKIGFPVVRPASKVIDGALYDIIVADCFIRGSNKDSANPTKHEDYKLYIAVNKAVVTAGKTAADILAALVKLK